MLANFFGSKTISESVVDAPPENDDSYCSGCNWNEPLNRYLTSNEFCCVGTHWDKDGPVTRKNIKYESWRKTWTLKRFKSFRENLNFHKLRSSQSVTTLSSIAKNELFNSDDHILLNKLLVHENDVAFLKSDLPVEYIDFQWLNSRGEVIKNDATFSTLIDWEKTILMIKESTLRHTGIYTCKIFTVNGIANNFTFLTVVARPSPPTNLHVVDCWESNVQLQWSLPESDGNLPIISYTIELLEQGIGIWQVIISSTANCFENIPNLNSGQTYLFRVSASNEAGISDPCELSNPITIPMRERRIRDEYVEEINVFWKNGFNRDFTIISDLGRGRFSSVKRCLQKLTNNEVAAKFISKKLCDVEKAENEFLMLQNFHHSQVIQALDTYQTASSFVLILEIVNGLQLFGYICEQPFYDEAVIVIYIKQLLEVVNYLHNFEIAHLDLKPENLIVDVTYVRPLLKLTDFGDAHQLNSDLYIHSPIGNLEFSAPELIAKQPISAATDHWSIGVLIYVLLGGVSPFLDDCDEETCSNILRCNYSFPEEYFSDISKDAKEVIEGLLVLNPTERSSLQDCLSSQWFQKGGAKKMFSTKQLSEFVERRRNEGNVIKDVTLTDQGILITLK